MKTVKINEGEYELSSDISLGHSGFILTSNLIYFLFMTTQVTSLLVFIHIIIFSWIFRINQEDIWRNEDSENQWRGVWTQ